MRAERPAPAPHRRGRVDPPPATPSRGPVRAPSTEGPAPVGRRRPVSLGLGDVVQLQKPHPCGGDRWRVLRVGADLRLQCVRCSRTVLVPRADIERRIRRVIPAEDPGLPEPGS